MRSFAQTASSYLETAWSFIKENPAETVGSLYAAAAALTFAATDLPKFVASAGPALAVSLAAKAQGYSHGATLLLLSKATEAFRISDLASSPTILGHSSVAGVGDDEWHATWRASNGVSLETTIDIPGSSGSFTTVNPQSTIITNATKEDDAGFQNSRVAVIAKDADGLSVVQHRSYTGMSAQFYDRNLLPVGSSIQLSSFPGSKTSPIAITYNGTFCGFWNTFNQVDYTDVVRRCFSNTTSLESEVIVNAITPGAQQDGSVARLPNGDFALGYQNYVSSWNIMLQIFDSNWVMKGSVISVSTGFQDNIQCSVGASDGIVPVVFAKFDPTFSYDVFVRCFNSNTGLPLISELRLNSNTPGDQSRPVIVCDKEYGCFAVWHGQPGFRITGQQISDTCTLIGSNFQVNPDSTGSQTNPAATWVTTSSGDKYALVTYTNQRPGNVYSIDGQTFTPPKLKMATTSPQIQQGGAVNFTDTIINATAVNTSSAEILIDVKQSVGGHVEHKDNPGAAVTQFNFAQLFSYIFQTDGSIVTPSVTFEASKGFLKSLTQTLTFNLTKLPPLLTGNPGDLIYTEKNPPLPIGNFTVTKGFAPITRVTFSIENNFANGEDVLSFANQSGTYSSANGNILVHNPADSSNVTYRDTSNNPSTLPRQFKVLATDASGQMSNPLSFNVNVNAVNDAPVLTSGASGALSFTEKNSPTIIFPALTLADVDSLNITSATVRFTSTPLSEDVLSFTSQGGITGIYNNGVLSLTGSALLAIWQQVLRSVTYYNPSLNPSSATRTVSLEVNDGQALSNIITRDITVTPVNDPPMLTESKVSVTGEQPVTLTLQQLDATDPDNAQNSLIFEVSGLQACRFERDGITVTQFTRGEVASGQIRLIPTGKGVTAPAYKVRVRDGQLATTPEEATVDFTPSIENKPGSTITNPIPQTEDNTIRNALITAGIGGAFTFGFFGVKYAIKKTSNKKLERILMSSDTEAGKSEYDNDVINIIGNHIKDNNINIAGAFESVSDKKAKEFKAAVRHIAAEMTALGVGYQSLNGEAQSFALDTIVQELKNIRAEVRGKNCWTRSFLYGFFNADVPPEQINKDATKIAKAFSDKLVAARKSQAWHNAEAKRTPRATEMLPLPPRPK